jgi:hypothetical protein
MWLRIKMVIFYKLQHLKQYAQFAIMENYSETIRDH